MDRITTDKDTTKSIKGDNQPGESIYCSNYLFLSAFILLIHVQKLFLGLIIIPIDQINDHLDNRVLLIRAAFGNQQCQRYQGVVGQSFAAVGTI